MVNKIPRMVYPSHRRYNTYPILLQRSWWSDPSWIILSYSQKSQYLESVSLHWASLQSRTCLFRLLRFLEFVSIGTQATLRHILYSVVTYNCIGGRGCALRYYVSFNINYHPPDCFIPVVSNAMTCTILRTVRVFLVLYEIQYVY